MVRRVARLLLALTVIAAAPSTVYAHPIIDEGWSLYEHAQFREALDAFARAEAATDLTLADLERLFASRALVYQAMGNGPAVEADLTRLAAIAPDHAFAADVPPELRDGFARIRGRSTGRLRLVVRAETTASGVTVEAEVADAPAAIVRTVRIVGRAADGPWREVADAPLVVTANAGARVSYYAEAIGPGGAVLARRGTEAEPLVAVVPRAAETVTILRDERGANDDDESGPGPWLWIGIAAGVVAIAAIVTSILVVRGDGLTDDTQATIGVVSWMD